MIWLIISIIATPIFLGFMGVAASRAIYRKGWLDGYEQYRVDAEVEEHE